MTIDQQWITSPLLFYIIPTYFLVEGSSVGRQLSNNLRKLIFASWRRVQSVLEMGRISIRQAGIGSNGVKNIYLHFKNIFSWR